MSQPTRPSHYPSADDERATVRGSASASPARGRRWWIPLAIVGGLLLAAIISVSQARHCGPVSTVTYRTPAERERALQRGDTVPAALQHGDLTAYEHVCTWGR